MASHFPPSQAKNGFPYPLLCDPSYNVIKALGAHKEKEGGASGITRSHIVVAKGGVVADVQYGVTPEESVERAKGLALKKGGTAAAAM